MKFSEFIHSDLSENFNVACVPETSDLSAKFMEVERWFAADRHCFGTSARIRTANYSFGDSCVAVTPRRY